MRIIRQTGWRSLFSKFLLPYSIAAVIGIPHLVANADDFPSGYDLIRDDGTDENRRGALNLIGAGVSCADDSANNETECTIAGGSSGNSFETIDVPAGTDPVADSATDTLTLTSTGATVTITGNSGTDTINLESTAGSGDISAVGDCATGACFTGSGTSSTQLTFDRPTTDITFGYVASTDDIELTNDLNLYDVEPHLSFYDTTTGADDYHFYADQSEFHLTNLTDNVELFRFDNANKFRVDETTLVVDRTTNQVILGSTSTVDPFTEVPILSLRTASAGGTSLFLQTAGNNLGNRITGFAGRGSLESPTDSSNNDVMLELNGVMHAGSDWASEPVASIKMLVDGTVGVDDFPTRLEFYTTPNGTADPIRRLLIDENGQGLWNATTDTSRSLITGPVQGPGLQIQSEGGTNADLSFATAGLSGADADLIWLSSNGTLDTPTIVLDQDILAAIGFAGYDGSDYERCATIEAYVGRADATAAAPGSNDMPEYLSFRTCPDGSNTRATRMMIDSTGVLIGGGAGVLLSQDADGALQLTGQGNGSDECLDINLDDTSNQVVVGNCAFSTGVTDLVSTLDIEVAQASPHISLNPDSGDTFGFHVDPTVSTAFINNETDSVHYLHFGSSHQIDIGSGSVPAVVVTTNSTGNSEVQLPADSIGNTEVMGGLSKCASIENLAAADDNVALGSMPVAVTVVAVWCHCYGTCSTPATIQLEDDAGNAMTGTATCDTGGGAATPTTITAGGALVAYEGLRFDVTNAVSPETDEYAICFGF